ncbi:unnamed protein product [Prorocentrum cordatum]|uniref:Uncharacterized protein n=1 Tax=Prorocentrum cordatum TaxID=2364126 RepID=A0ABN9RHB9_9DINO|nr:unnamed protein product [Polarella glacialis]
MWHRHRQAPRQPRLLPRRGPRRHQWTAPGEPSPGEAADSSGESARAATHSALTADRARISGLASCPPNLAARRLPLRRPVRSSPQAVLGPCRLQPQRHSCQSGLACAAPARSLMD